jgi:hypothetical protein
MKNTIRPLCLPLLLVLAGCIKLPREAPLQHSASESSVEAVRIAAENKKRGVADPIGAIVNNPRLGQPIFTREGPPNRTGERIWLPGDIRLLDGHPPDWDAILTAKGAPPMMYAVVLKPEIEKLHDGKPKFIVGFGARMLARDYRTMRSLGASR